MDRLTRIAWGSVGIGCAVLALKAAAWWRTGSAAFYSDALESVVNVAAAGIALTAIRFAAQPADANHPFGHAKAEFVAASIEGALIVVAAFSIVQNAWAAWLHPQPPAATALGVALNLGASAINFGWAQLLFRSARHPPAPALAADARHLLADVVTSLGIVAGVLLAVITGRPRVDAAVAALTAAYVLWSGLRLLGSSVGGLMDMAPAPSILTRIRAVVAENGAGAIEAHDIRTRQAGRVTFLQFHLVVPGDMPVREAHAICDRIENALSADMADLIVNIHVEPEHKAKPHDALALR